jgi:hypothetical protein
MNYLDPDYFYVATGTIDGDDIGAVECRWLIECDRWFDTDNVCRWWW